MPRMNVWTRASMNSFQTTLNPNPDKFYEHYSVMIQHNMCLNECALQVLSSSGAGGLITVHRIINPATPTRPSRL